MKFNFNYKNGELIEATDNQELIELLSLNKNKIDTIADKWNKVKKMIHDYEFIYTSPNKKKNISNITPISRSYFKLKEIVKDYDIKLDNSIIFSMAEAPGGFIQELLEYNVNKIYANTLKIYDPSVPRWNINLLNNKKINFYYGIKNNGDLMDLNNLLSYIKYIGKSSVDLITADGGFDYSNDYNKQEINSLPLIYSEILLALNILKPGGIFICKIFDFFLKETINLIYILTLLFDQVYIHKPKFSRLSNSEKYLVCLNYKGYDKNIINELIRYYKTSKIIIKVDSNFKKKIDEFTNNYIDKQIEQINKGVEIINSKKKERLPSELQINKAIEWCNQYDIEINKQCYYISGHSSHDNFRIGSE